MIAGRVDASGVPTILLDVGGRQWPCTLDTGFDRDVELSCELRPAVNARFFSRVRAQLAGGQDIEEECYRAQFPFDGETLIVHASFAPTDRILIGPAPAPASARDRLPEPQGAPAEGVLTAASVPSLRAPWREKTDRRLLL